MPGVEEDRHRGTADHGADVGIRQHDDRRLAAQLERHAFERVGRAFVDELAHLGRTGKRDLVHAGVRDQRGAGGLPETGQDIDHARRETGFADQLTEPERR